jgi:hypothetical protein
VALKQMFSEYFGFSCQFSFDGQSPSYDRHNVFAMLTALLNQDKGKAIPARGREGP